MVPALLLVAAAAASLGAYGWHERRVGELRATIRVRDAAIVALRGRSARRDTAYVRVRDTLRVVRWRTDSLLRRDTLRFTDTLIHRDTVIQLVERERLACDAVISACAARVAVRDSIIAVQTEVIELERGKDRLPLFHVKLPSRTASLGIGVGAGLLAGLLLRR